MKALKLLLYPFAILYGIAVMIRNFLFDVGMLPSANYSFPLINVGNLAAGGTGKSPHVEYLVKLISKHYNVATLSRGYGRKTTGFKEVEQNASFFDVGDEPKMFKAKFPHIPVFVDSNRKRGISKIKQQLENNDCIVLDDAYQHRYVTPGLNILLTEYSKLYINDYLLPTGYLREPAWGAKRADIIVVTKCPSIFSPVDARAIRKSLNVRPYQVVYFSYFKYGSLIPVYANANGGIPNLTKKMNVVLATGIAKPTSLLFTLKDKVKEVNHIKFPDHHVYTVSDINRILMAYDQMEGEDKIILTTEKDAMRFHVEGIKEMLGRLPFFYIPVEVDFHGKDKEDFNDNILTYVKRNFKSG